MNLVHCNSKSWNLSLFEYITTHAIIHTAVSLIVMKWLMLFVQKKKKKNSVYDNYLHILSSESL